VINNKISNVCAPDGIDTAERICAETARLLGFEATEVLPSSTGVIGWQLPLTEMLAALPRVAVNLQTDTILPAAEAIMTTDLYPKVRCATVGNGRIVGIAKGAGMIEPNMATMLVYLLTDLQVSRETLRSMLSRAVSDSFNAISIDSDQSTSDTVVLLSSGRVPDPDQNAVATALTTVCGQLAEDVVRNGEGVKHVVKVIVQRAPTMEIAKGVGKTVVNSPLLQCAVCGNDPNVGRLVMAVGKYLGNEHPDVDVTGCRMDIGRWTVFSNGAFRLNPGLETQLNRYMKSAELYETTPPNADGVFRPPVSWPTHQRTVDICIDLGAGDSAFTVTGCDRTHEYISENADYRS